MLGFADGWVAAVYILCLLSSLLCIVYGAANWNKGGEEVSAEDKQWAEEESKIEEEL